MKLTFKITAAVLITVISLLLFFGFFIVKDEKIFLEHLQNKQGKAIVNTISISIVDAVLLNDYPAIDTIIENTSKAYKDISSVRVIINNKIVSQFYNQGLTKHTKKLYKSDVMINDEVLGTVVSEISNFENTKLINKRIEKMVIISILISILLIIILIFIVKYFLINKINFISNSTKRINLDNLNKLIEINTTDEFKDLANNINEMTKQLSLEIKDNKLKNKLLAEQSKMADMGEMLGNIAHQWRQPLSVISTGVTGMKIQKEFSSLSDEDFLSSCDMINENAQYLSRTIDDFSNYIKGDSQIIKFNIKDNINSVLKLIDSTAKSNNIEIILEKIEDAIIFGYPNELQQCVINIFNNAKDAFNETNTKEKYFFIRAEIIDDYVCIKLKDNAGGIPEELLNKIFEPYFTTKHNSVGIGLGLSMTYDLIVNSMKGTIEAHNIEVKHNNLVFTGAEFSIMLSLKKETSL